MGVTAASLREGGTDPDLREQLMMEAKSLEMAGRLSLTRLEDIGSSVQVELIPVMKSDSCMGVTGEKWDRGCEVKGGSQEGRWGVLMRVSDCCKYC